MTEELKGVEEKRNLPFEAQQEWESILAGIMWL